MKKLLIYFFILFSIKGFSQAVLQETLDFSVQEISINEALQQLAKVADTDIAFSSNFFKKADLVSLDLKHTSFQSVLDEILKNTSITYKVSNGQIILFKKKIPLRTISGYIEDKATGERLIAATIYCPTLQKGTTSNEYGFYSLTLPQGLVQINFSYVGYEQEDFQLDLKKSTQQNIQLNYAQTLAEVVVTTETNSGTSNIDKTSPIHNILRPSNIAISPSLGGEPDPVRVAQLIPGVQSGADGLGGLYVRGGESGHNLMLLDGVPVYIPYHMLGMFSIYNPNTIRSAKLYRGTFPARYGGRLSSVFDVRTREGNQNKWSAQAGANLISTNFLLEGPFQKKKGSILVSGRRSHKGSLLNPFFQRTFFQMDSEELESQFYDLNIKANYQFSQNDRLYLSFYSGFDTMLSETEFEEEDFFAEEAVELNWSNTTFALRWNHLYNDKLFSNTTLTYSLFNYQFTVLEEFREDIENDPDDLYFVDTRSTNNDIGLNVDFDFIPNPQHHFKFGGGISFREFSPQLTYFDELDEELEDLENYAINDFEGLIEEETFEATESFVYVEDQIAIKKWQFNLGFRASSFFKEEQNFFRLEPRIKANYQIKKGIGLHAGMSRMVQYLHLVSYNNVRLPNDLWIPSGEGLQPEESWQTELGLVLQPNSKTSIGLEAYYKKMDNLYSYPDGYDFEDIDILNVLINGTGESLGTEFTFQYEGKKIGLFASYAYTKSFRIFEEINAGEPFAAAYDQPHQVKLFSYYRIHKNWTASANWTFHSPSPRLFIQPLGSEPIENPISEEIVGERNSIRNEAYHRLDLSINFQFKTAKLYHSLKFGGYNIYSRENIAYYRIDFQEEDNLDFTPVNGLPFRPSLSYSLKF